MSKHEAASVFEWTVTGMDCGSCAGKIKGAVERLPGVSAVEVALMSERLRLQLDESQTRRQMVEKAVSALGFGISPRAGQEQGQSGKTAGCCGHEHHGHDHDDGHGHGHHHDHAHGDAHSHSHGHEDEKPLADGSRRAWHQTGKGRLVTLTGALLALAWAAHFVLPPQVGAWVFTVACVIGVAPVARRAFAALAAGMPFTIEMLMTIAAAGALAIGAAEEAALVVFLFAVGEVLEGVAANRARDGIRALARLVPKTALLETDSGTRQVAAESLAPGQMVLVRPGDRIPADGVIRSGISGIDESPVTGESVPVTKGEGAEVFAGSINTEAALSVEVTRAAADNTIARIIKLVEEAESARAPTERFIDRFSRYYMPFIVLLAATVAVVPPLGFGGEWNTWIYRALSLLLIGCPCALVISVPASIASSLSAGARRGLLMKGGAVIEAIAQVKMVTFDKTGTLTAGRPQVVDVVSFGGLDVLEVISAAASVEAGSSHPLAKAILTRAQETGASVLPSSGARAMAGRGVEALVAGELLQVISPRHASETGLLPQEAAAQAERLEGEGKTVVCVIRTGNLAGLVALRDEPREDAREAIGQLERLGVGAVMLTGDNARTAAAIATGLGLTQRAELMPEDKVREVRALAASGGVMMVGDGINDAPALAQASVGVAMGSGTDVALETAHAAVLRDRVTDVPALIRLARKAMGNIHQNITIALGLKAVFLVTSILGITGLWLAIMADTGATVLVTLNALRLLAYDPAKEV